VRVAANARGVGALSLIITSNARARRLIWGQFGNDHQNGIGVRHRQWRAIARSGAMGICAAALLMISERTYNAGSGVTPWHAARINSV